MTSGHGAGDGIPLDKTATPKDVELKQAEADASKTLTQFVMNSAMEARAVEKLSPGPVASSKAGELVHDIAREENREQLNPNQIAASLEKLAQRIDAISDFLFTPDPNLHTSFMDRMKANSPDLYNDFVITAQDTIVGQKLMEQHFELSFGETRPADRQSLFSKMKDATQS